MYVRERERGSTGYSMFILMRNPSHFVNSHIDITTLCYE